MEKHNQALANQLYERHPSSDQSGLSGKPSEFEAMERRRKLMAALWKRMREYFGQSWVRQYGEVNGEAINAWTDALGIFSEEQIARGVKACQDWTGDFPPTLAQFKSMCLTVRNKPTYTERRIEREKRQGSPDSMIEHLSRNANSDVAQRELARMRRVDQLRETKEESMAKLGLNRRWS